MIDQDLLQGINDKRYITVSTGTYTIDRDSLHYTDFIRNWTADVSDCSFSTTASIDEDLLRWHDLLRNTQTTSDLWTARIQPPEQENLERSEELDEFINGL